MGRGRTSAWEFAGGAHRAAHGTTTTTTTSHVSPTSDQSPATAPTAASAGGMDASSQASVPRGDGDRGGGGRGGGDGGPLTGGSGSGGGGRGAGGVAQADQCANIGCTNSASSKCSACKAVHYCRRECQATHWKAHKPVCRQACTQTHHVGAAASAGSSASTSATAVAGAAGAGAGAGAAGAGARADVITATTATTGLLLLLPQPFTSVVFHMLTVADRLRLASCNHLWRRMVLAEGAWRTVAIKQRVANVRVSAATRLLRSISKAHLHTLRLGGTSDVAHTVNVAGPFPSVRVLELGLATKVCMAAVGGTSPCLAAAIMTNFPRVADIALATLITHGRPVEPSTHKEYDEHYLPQQVVQLQVLMAQRQVATGEAPATLDVVVCDHTAADGAQFDHVRSAAGDRVQCTTCGAYSDCKAFHGATISLCMICSDAVACTDCVGILCTCGRLLCGDGGRCVPLDCGRAGCYDVGCYGCISADGVSSTCARPAPATAPMNAIVRSTPSAMVRSTPAVAVPRRTRAAQVARAGFVANASFCVKAQAVRRRRVVSAGATAVGAGGTCAANALTRWGAAFSTAMSFVVGPA